MTSKPRPKLSAALSAPKQSAERQESAGEARPARQERGSKAKGPGIVLRLSPEAHAQLKDLAHTEGRSIQSLLIEGLNGLFRDHGKPPIA